jgi:hypothetical protein
MLSRFVSCLWIAPPVLSDKPRLGTSRAQSATDERVAPVRQASFLQDSGFDAAAPGTVADWFQAHKSYTVANVARAAESVTFTDENRPAWLCGLESRFTLSPSSFPSLCDVDLTALLNFDNVAAPPP